MRKSNKQPYCLGNAIRNCQEECSPQQCDLYLPIGWSHWNKLNCLCHMCVVHHYMQEGDVLHGWYGVHTSGIQYSHKCCGVNYDSLK
jgi:hypothetical protein